MEIAATARAEESPNGEPAVHRWTGWNALESLAVFAIGAVLMNFIYAGPADSGTRELGVPGHDSFYHIKMAALIPQHGLLDKQLWLKFVYFTEQGDAFVSHHYGFHVLLVPFVTASHWLTGDYLPGGRWAIATTFGLTMMLFNLLLISGRVHWRWFWLFLFLLLPFQFFTRHAFIRAISPSLMFMLLIVLLTFRERCKLAGLAVAAYTHLYLGGVIYAPLLVGLCVVSSLIGPRGDRGIPWKLIIFTAAGWIVGALIHPYREGMWEFLRLQVFGSGLSPDISVGREWKPYENVWWFAQAAGNVLLIWAIAVSLRLRFGKRISANELFLVIVNFAFLALTFKARRFIEYWPVFCLLSAAFLVAPLTEHVTKWVKDGIGSSVAKRACWLGGSTLVLLTVSSVWLYAALRRSQVDAFLAEWEVWTALAALYLLAPLCRIWVAKPTSGGRRVAKLLTPLGVPVCGIIFVAGMAFLYRCWITPRVGDGRLVLGGLGWIGLLLLYLVAAYRPGKEETSDVRLNPWLRCLGGLRAVVLGVAFLSATACFAGPSLAEMQRTTRCKYDLPAVRGAMRFLEEHSHPGDVVFTDDWDIFPVYFYYNSHNRYVVGLDPKFTHARRPDLWERYVKVSRGQVPADVTVALPDESGTEVQEQLHVVLKDIREHFGARYVVTDADHRSLASKLARADDFAELVYPSTSYAQSRDEHYLVFRIRSEDGMDTIALPKRATGHD